MKDIVALLLAGGDSSRFWPLVDKHALTILGKPLTYYPISQLAKFGITQIVIVVNEKNKADFSRLANFFPTLTINIVKQIDSHGMAGAIMSAKKYIAGKNLLIIGPSDIYEDIILSDLDKQLVTSPDGIIAGATVTRYFPGGYLVINKGNVDTIIEKPHPSKAPSDIISFVFDYFKNADILLSAIEDVETQKDDHFEKALDLLIKKGQIFKFLPYKGYWGYLKYPWHTLSVSSYYLNKIAGKKIKNAIISSSATITGDVFIEDNVRILENAKIIGPTYIGKGTIVGNNCLIRESMIGANCVVGFTSEIARSYIADNCWFHNNYVGDSVLSQNVSMGAGSITANFRLDEQPVRSKIGLTDIDTGKSKLGTIVGPNVRIGVNACLMPGVKIGKNSFIGAAVVLDQDLADDQFCSLKNSNYIVRKNKITLPDKPRNLAKSVTVK